MPHELTKAQKKIAREIIEKGEIATALDSKKNPRPGTYLNGGIPTN